MQKRILIICSLIIAIPCRGMELPDPLYYSNITQVVAEMNRGFPTSEQRAQHPEQLNQNALLVTQELTTALQTIERKKEKIKEQKRKLKLRSAHIGYLLSQLALHINDNDAPEELSLTRQIIQQNESTIGNLRQQLDQRNEHIGSLLSQLALHIQEDPSRHQKLDQLRQITTSLIQERQRNENRLDTLLPHIEQALVALNKIPASLSSQKSMIELCKPFINQAVITEDQPLLNLLKKLGIGLPQLGAEDILEMAAKPRLIYSFVNGEECTICRESYTTENPRIRICGHIFCDSCYEELKTKPCPICRRDINGNEANPNPPQHHLTEDQFQSFVLYNLVLRGHTMDDVDSWEVPPNFW